MGIQGLLPQLKSIMQPIHVKELQGCSVAVDTYSWLHKGALSCSKQLCTGLPTTRHIEYCMHRVNLLRHYGVKPVLVFDGGFLPMKTEEENKRARSRKENLARAIEHESNGNGSAAYDCYQKAVDISPSIAHDLIQVLKKEKICYVVAPYEADAQMTFLAVSKQVDAVITEDSDLIPFGCPRVIYKMDKFGQGVEFRYSMLHQNKELNFVGFTKQMVLEMCILSGCDYLQSLPGMGLKKAHALIKKFKSYDRVIKHLRYNTAAVPPLYEESFKKAMLTFRHQRVYDPISEAIVHLSDISGLTDDDDDSDFLGPSMPHCIAKAIANGDLDPITKLPFQGMTPNSQSSESSFDNTGHPKVARSEIKGKKLDLPAKNNLLSKYFCYASVEAKREFKAPRNHLTGNNSSPMDDCSPSPTANTTDETPPYQPKSFRVSPLNHLKVQSESNDECAEISEPSESDEVEALDGERRLRPSPLQHSVHPISIAPFLVDEGHECSNTTSVRIEGKTVKAIGKVIVRSRYFQHKPALEKEQESVLAENCSTSTTTTTTTTAQLEHVKRIISKRKMLLNDPVEMEDVQPKRPHTYCSSEIIETVEPEQLQAEDSLENEEGSDRLLSSAEEHFGSNISHIGRYSSIAENSMEKFVSTISSFRYSCSGSRASGLRPPLKDVKSNISISHRSKSSTTAAAADFSKFAYAPKDRTSSKATLSSRRR